MRSPTVQELDNIRKRGYRPGVVGCFISNKRLLFLYQNKYNLWMFPQGGVENKETAEQAMTRVMTEEVGAKFYKEALPEKTVFHQKSLEFPKTKQGSKKLLDDSGKFIYMLGKHYLFYVINTKQNQIDIKDTQFDEYFWLKFSAIKLLTDHMYIKNKAKIIFEAAKRLKDAELIE